MYGNTYYITGINFLALNFIHIKGIKSPHFPCQHLKKKLFYFIFCGGVGREGGAEFLSLDHERKFSVIHTNDFCEKKRKVPKLPDFEDFFFPEISNF
jgi:hypothetical protein